MTSGRTTKAATAAKEMLEGKKILPEPEVSIVDKQNKMYVKLRMSKEEEKQRQEDERETLLALKEGRIYVKPEESKEVPYFIEQFEQQIIDVNKTDFDLIGKTNQAKGMALHKNELEAYQKLVDKKMTKPEIEKYLAEDQVREANRILQAEQDQMNKDYPPNLNHPGYNEFWEEIKRPVKPKSRES